MFLDVQLFEYNAGDFEHIQDVLPMLSAKQLVDAVWGLADQTWKAQHRCAKPNTDVMHVMAQEIQVKLPAFRWDCKAASVVNGTSHTHHLFTPYQQ
jgi:hypothetical protein